MAVYICLWWLCYIVVALVLQQSLPGMDALAAGLLLALQLKNRTLIIILFSLFTIIQEGVGTLPFGGVMLWYMGHMVLFYVSSRVFVSSNLLFITLLSCGLCAYKFCLLWFLCMLTNTHFDYVMILRESAVQSFITPVLWGIAYMLYPKVARYGH